MPTTSIPRRLKLGGSEASTPGSTSVAVDSTTGTIATDRAPRPRRTSPRTDSGKEPEGASITQSLDPVRVSVKS